MFDPAVLLLLPFLLLAIFSFVYILLNHTDFQAIPQHIRFFLRGQ